MNWRDLVDGLCRAAGVEFFYFDIAGTRHETSLETKVLVLSALGFDVSSIPAAARARRAEEDRPWRLVLPRFSVRPLNNQGMEADLFIPAADRDGNWNWTLTLEGGGSERDDFRPTDLPLLGSRDVDGRQIERRRLTIRRTLKPGYHRIRIAGSGTAEGTIALTPRRCHLPDGLDSPQRRVWGLLAHLYTLRSRENWGVGDFGDLARLARMAGAEGAAAIATNPFHALFPYVPEAASPYSPSSRLFLNPIYIDIEAAPHAKDSAAIAAERQRLEPVRAEPLVNYPAVWAAKRAAFEALYRSFQNDIRTGTPLAQEFSAFAAEGGDMLKRYGAFAALEDEHQRVPWTQWRAGFHDAAGDQVQDFIRNHPDRIGFHLYLQFLADRQLGEAARTARDSGMRIGFVRDLALGINPDGADAWIMGEAFATNLRCGAPPDPFNPRGQEWGVLPLNPNRLRENGEIFARLVRANMQHAGGLRIDHVIGLQRQFLVPLGGEPAQGCYVRFPFEDLIGLLALESERNSCMVIGEDLGTVPPGFRDRMADANAMGCSILYFERTESAFKAPAEYRVRTVASIATHDLPTLAGFWEDRDIDVRERVGISSPEEADAARRERAHERRMLWNALREAGLLEAAGNDPGGMAPPLTDAVHAFLASASAQIFLAQIDDLTGERDQINVPGTIDSYPNWRRKISLALNDPAVSGALQMLGRICAARGRATSG